MPIYWLLLGFPFLIWPLFTRFRTTVVINNKVESRAILLHAILIFTIIIFFTGMRSRFIDTGTYISLFNKSATNLNVLFNNPPSKDIGFSVMMVLFKQFVSSNSQVWIFFIALFSGIMVMIPLVKHSSSLTLSVFLFIATTQFTWLMNGIRQFIVISVLFCALHLLTQHKKWKYLFLVLLLTPIHFTAVLMLPIYFIATAKPWSRRMVASTLLFCFIAAFSNNVLIMMEPLINATQYNGIVTDILDYGGMRIPRFLVSLVPCILAFVYRKRIEIHNNPTINLSVNMAVITSCIYLIATMIGGNFIARIAEYFDIYNLILIPWLLSNAFRGKLKVIVCSACILLYTIFFYYQMGIVFNGVYASDMLGIYY